MFTNRLALILLLIILVSARTQAHAPGFTGAVAGVPLQYDFRNHRIGSGVAINGCIILFNAGVDYRRWFSKMSPQSEYDVYLGLGLGPLVQVQYGSGPSVRLRSDMIFLTETPHLFSTEGARGLALSACIEKFYSPSDKSWLISVSVGVTL